MITRQITHDDFLRRADLNGFLPVYVVPLAGYPEPRFCEGWHVVQEVQVNNAVNCSFWTERPTREQRRKWVQSIAL